LSGGSGGKLVEGSVQAVATVRHRSDKRPE
jgi:hypothetical protein